MQKNRTVFSLTQCFNTAFLHEMAKKKVSHVYLRMWTQDVRFILYLMLTEHRLQTVCCIKLKFVCVFISDQHH